MKGSAPRSSAYLLLQLGLAIIGCSKDRHHDSSSDEPVHAPEFIYEERVLYCRSKGDPVPGECLDAGAECCCGRECCSGMCADGQCVEACAGTGESCTDLGKSTQCCSGRCNGSGLCTCNNTKDIPCRVDADCCSGFCNPDNSHCEWAYPADRAYAPAPICESRGTSD